MNYFKFFPTMNYTFQEGNTHFLMEITNFAEHVKLAERVRTNITVMYDFVIQDGMRPDSVSQQLYGTPAYTWIILLINNIFSLFDWPLTGDEFNAYIIEKYGSIGAAQAQVLYRTVDGYAVDITTWTALTTSQKGINTNTYDDEFDTNEQKRRIKVVPAEFVTAIVQELKKIL